ncbi:MAG: peroxiredoxin [Gammaproteobacteria bacterium]|nr:peroxiredoxin [Gammaproteobacteria bacterium]
MLAIGKLAPDFALPDQDGREQRLSRLIDDQPLIVYFYPADFTPGCTAEACDIRDLHTQILSAGLRVVGVSPQPPESHRRFRDQHGLPFTLLSDVAKVAIKAFDVDGPFGIGVRRATFLLDAKRKIIDAVQADLRISRHQDFIQRAIAARESRSA